MSETQVLLKDCLTAAESSAKDFVLSTLGYNQYHITDYPPALPEIHLGSYVALLSESAKMEIAVLTDHKGCIQLAKDMLGSEPDSEADVADALGEIANILAGGVKRQLPDRLPRAQIGLPFLLKGKIQFGEKVQLAASRARWGELEVLLVVLIKPENGDSRRAPA